MRVMRSRRWVPRHQIQFVGLSESAADPPRRRPASWYAPPGSGPVVFDCPRSRAPRPLEHCLSCEYFVGHRPVPHRRQIALTCLCTDRDPILRCADARASWPTIGPSTTMRAARRLAIVHDAPLLLVTRDDALLGIVYRERLVGSDAPVESAMTQYPWSLSARATLGEAVEALRASEVPALLVLAADLELVAVVSVDHLVRLGVPNELLPSRPSGSAGR